MKELRSIFQALDAQDNYADVGLATVVRIKGSSYRNVGAKMLVTGQGRWTGGISGGCLEGDALRKIQGVLASGIPTTHTYDTSTEQGGPIGAALGCNGLIEVLFEPFAPNTTLFSCLRENVAERKPSVIGYVFGEGAGGEELHAKFLYDGTIKGAIGTPRPWSGRHAQEVLIAGVSALRQIVDDDTQYTVLFEVVHPPIHLHVFGAGRDVVPLTQMAHLLGWDASVHYNCQVQMMTAGFADDVEQHVIKAENIDVRFDARTPAIIMSHNYKFDKRTLDKLIDDPAIPYLGILGPRKRTVQMLDELGKKATDCMYFPAGLNLAADGPEEIALSILSEMQAVLRGTDPAPLRDHDGPVHDRRRQEVRTVVEGLSTTKAGV